jgi:hypothetical protein
MQRFSTTHLVETKQISPPSSPVAITPEMPILGVFIAIALGCFFYKRYRVLMLRRSTQALERMWQLEAAKRVGK